jgi:hypothetical protein
MDVEDYKTDGNLCKFHIGGTRVKCYASISRRLLIPRVEDAAL